MSPVLYSNLMCAVKVSDKALYVLEVRLRGVLHKSYELSNSVGDIKSSIVCEVNYGSNGYSIKLLVNFL